MEKTGKQKTTANVWAAYFEGGKEKEIKFIEELPERNSRQTHAEIGGTGIHNKLPPPALPGSGSMGLSGTPETLSPLQSSPK
jgi:hypothetical protein